MYIPTVGLFLLATVALMIGGQGLRGPLTDFLHVIDLKMGWLFLGIYIINFVFLIGLAISKFGKIKIGHPDDEPVYSGFKWGAMVFATAIDASIMMLSITDRYRSFKHRRFTLNRFPMGPTLLGPCWGSLTGDRWLG